MSCYLRFEGASPSFLSALDQLAHVHVTELAHASSTQTKLFVKPVSHCIARRSPQACTPPDSPRAPINSGAPYQPSGLISMTFNECVKANAVGVDMPPLPLCHKEADIWSETPRVKPESPRSLAESERKGLDSVPSDCSDAGNFENDATAHSSDKDVVAHVSRATVNIPQGEGIHHDHESIRAWMKRLSRNQPSREGSKGSASSDGSTNSVRASMRQIVNSDPFEGFFSTIIVCNCVTMGLEAEQIVKGPTSRLSEQALATTEHLFTALFSVELLCKYVGFGRKAFYPSFPDGNWNIADLLIVMVTGVLFTWILPLLALVLGFENDTGTLRTLLIFRSLRLFRMVRVVQRIPQFHEAWLLLRGLLDSGRVLMWTVVVVIFITYIFAIMGMILISKELAERRDANVGDVDRHTELTQLLELVGGLDAFMFTLIQLLTLDSWNAIVRRMIKELSWCWVFFYAYIAVAVIVLMNLVTAIIVENAVANSKMEEDQALQQRETRRQAEIKDLANLFGLMDSDGSGTLSWDEFKAAFDDPEITRKWKLLDFEPEECRELFGLLDDGDGEIEMQEFFVGLAKMKGGAQSKDIFRLQTSLDALADTLKSDAYGSGASKK